MAVEPVAISAGIANVTLALPLAKDALITGANFMVENTVGVILIGMSLISYGVGKVIGMFRSRRGRR